MYVNSPLPLICSGMCNNLASAMLLQVLGASWYLLSIERYATCWKSECRKEFSPAKCYLFYLDCGTLNDHDRQLWENGTVVFNNCDPTNSNGFQYGIFGSALANNVVSSDFLEKYFYCLWWGLQNLRYASLMLHNLCFLSNSIC